MNERIRKFCDLSRPAVSMDKYLKQIEAGTPLICVTGFDLLFPDNIYGRCAMCHCPIQFRPYNKVATFKICVACAPKLLEEGEAS
jgi:hypothetical protein